MFHSVSGGHAGGSGVGGRSGEGGSSPGGDNSQGGGRCLSVISHHVDGSHNSGGRRGDNTYIGGHADGSHSDGGRRGRSIQVGGRAGGSYNDCGGNIGGGSVSHRGNGWDYEPYLSNDDIYDASFEDSEEDDQFDDVDDGDKHADEAGGNGGDDGGGGDVESDDTDDDGDDIFYSRRGYSLGTYATVPQKPHPIRMVKKVIDDPTASCTLLALTRIYWPVGCIGTIDIDRCCPHGGGLLGKCFLYGTKQDARREVIFHLHDNKRKAQANERKRVQKLIKEKGGSFLDHRPPYLSEAVWKVFCEYWETPEFKKKSEIVKNNKKKAATLHRSGATSFRGRTGRNR